MARRQGFCVDHELLKANTCRIPFTWDIARPFAREKSRRGYYHTEHSASHAILEKKSSHEIDINSIAIIDDEPGV